MRTISFAAIYVNLILVRRIRKGKKKKKKEEEFIHHTMPLLFEEMGDLNLPLFFFFFHLKIYYIIAVQQYGMLV